MIANNVSNKKSKPLSLRNRRLKRTASTVFTFSFYAKQHLIVAFGFYKPICSHPMEEVGAVRATGNLNFIPMFYADYFWFSRF